MGLAELNPNIQAGLSHLEATRREITCVPCSIQSCIAVHDRKELRRTSALCFGSCICLSLTVVIKAAAPKEH
jgi:hypothetical protein